MPLLTHHQRIREILELDRIWGAYALADLEPVYAQFTTWIGARHDQPAIMLLYRAFATPILMAVGATESLCTILDEVEAELAYDREFCAVVRPDLLEALRPSYHVRQVHSMWRMVLVRDSLKHECHDCISRVSRLGAADLKALGELYADGMSKGAFPEFFMASLLEQGAYYGVYEGPALVAVAGTHVIAPSVGVAAIGNVYVRRDRRSQGHASRATAAVTSRLLEMGLDTIVLNVRQDNAPAIKVYERLGFRKHCEFREAFCVRGTPPS